MKTVAAICKRTWRRNWAFARLGILSNIEYRFNFAVDALLQPILTVLVESTLWLALFQLQGSETFAGFTRNQYLSYVIWSSFVARLTTNWMYEFRMINEIESGSLNSLLVRPISFFESYLSQFLGYKLIVTAASLCVPIGVCLIFDFPVFWSRLPLALLTAAFYMFFLYLLSFCVATFAFHLTRITGLSVAKNLTLAVLSGEILPLDLFPPGWHNFLVHLPFASGVYIPVGYLTGRIAIDQVWQAAQVQVVSLAGVACLARFLWRKGLRTYVGTGA